MTFAVEVVVVLKPVVNDPQGLVVRDGLHRWDLSVRSVRVVSTSSSRSKATTRLRCARRSRPCASSYCATRSSKIRASVLSRVLTSRRCERWGGRELRRAGVGTPLRRSAPRSRPGGSPASEDGPPPLMPPHLHRSRLALLKTTSASTAGPDAGSA